ncbi:MAG: type II toxin-antitoxin system RelE/ParE family toxin [Candidatus Omnitrophota bacterium]
MSAAWKVKIHRLVLADDFKHISRPQQLAILKAIDKKLSLDPHAYGKPLVGELKGYWRLRAGDYRVIYKIHQEAIEVLVVKVGIRRDDAVYLEMLKRLQALN